MRTVRTFRTGTVVAVIAWKLSALALLPAALCCRAVMMTADDGAGPAPACCAGGEHGAACPMKRAAPDGDAEAQESRPRMAGCDSLDDALVGLFGLTGFTPDAFEWRPGADPLEHVTEVHPAAASRAGAPSPPPPRT